MESFFSTENQVFGFVFEIFFKKLYRCYSCMSRGLQNNRPISVGFGHINTDIALEKELQFLYNNIQYKSLYLTFGLGLL